MTDTAVATVALILSIFTFATSTFPKIRKEHRRCQQSRRRSNGHAPPWWMCWTYWFGVERAFFGSKMWPEDERSDRAYEARLRSKSSDDAEL